MQIGAPASKKPEATPVVPSHTHPPSSITHQSLPWANPAAAAALRSSVDMLKGIEAGILKNFQDVERVRAYSTDLRSTSEIFSVASEAVNGGNKEDDQFLPLIKRAGAGVTGAEVRLSSKEITSTWPLERTDILGAIRAARVLTENVARQLDPMTSSVD